MPDINSEPVVLVGTAAYDNWRACSDGKLATETFEHPLYSDAYLTGQMVDSFGPYQFINIGNFLEPFTVRPVVVLRWSAHLALGYSKIERTDYSRYHGGWIVDEMAALASLKCGVRFRAGALSRRFHIDGEPKGQPISWSNQPEPSLYVPPTGVVLPTVRGEHTLMGLQEISSFPSLTADQAITLVRAARLYQDALWLSESETNLGWLMLVSAVETAAKQWRNDPGPALDRMRASRPDFVDYLEGLGIGGVAEHVAKEFESFHGLTRTFQDFLLEFAPDPPAKRPETWAQFDWSRKTRQTAFRTIYNQRSKALHDGTPFPAPVCRGPERVAEWEAPAERPTALGASSHGATWLAKDLPMYFHTFEFIVRTALNNWWASMSYPAA